MLIGSTLGVCWHVSGPILGVCNQLQQKFPPVSLLATPSELIFQNKLAFRIIIQTVLTLAAVKILLIALGLR